MTNWYLVKLIDENGNMVKMQRTTGKVVAREWVKNNNTNNYKVLIYKNGIGKLI